MPSIVNLRTFVGLARAATGLFFIVAPTRPAKAWTGTGSTSTEYLTRAVGARDLAIGTGLSVAEVIGSDSRGWLLASIAGDAVDAASAITLDSEQRNKALAIAGGFGLLGLVALLRR